jgi:uncharacterized protein (DUF1499 family)
VSRLGFLLLALALALLAAVLWVRLSPNDPARWHVDVAEPAGPADPAPGDCASRIEPRPGGARASCLLALPPAEALARLDRIALAGPRTVRLAGSPESGRITWLTRSALWGFPDLTTAQAVATPQGSRLDILARQRFGQKDFGVNAARLSAWLSAL